MKVRYTWVHGLRSVLKVRNSFPYFRSWFDALGAWTKRITRDTSQTCPVGGAKVKGSYFIFNDCWMLSK